MVSQETARQHEKPRLIRFGEPVQRLRAFAFPMQSNNLCVHHFFLLSRLWFVAWF
jgi:hypothetical protein